MHHVFCTKRKRKKKKRKKKFNFNADNLVASATDLNLRKHQHTDLPFWTTFFKRCNIQLPRFFKPWTNSLSVGKLFEWFKRLFHFILAWHSGCRRANYFLRKTKKRRKRKTGNQRLLRYEIKTKQKLMITVFTFSILFFDVILNKWFNINSWYSISFKKDCGRMMFHKFSTNLGNHFCRTWETYLN